MRITIRHKLHENIERLSLFWGWRKANLQDAEDFINLGASRLGTSRIVKAVKAMEK